MVTREGVADSVARVVKLLDNPRLAPCPRNSVVRDARAALIAQIFWGDRVLAAYRDGIDPMPFADEMAKAYHRGHAALDKFVDCIRNKDCNGV
ncbi:MAG: hypothetical protein WC315_00860 [Candidatus Omnitrophota bacterium]|jgi:hypothetical protein